MYERYNTVLDVTYLKANNDCRRSNWNLWNYFKFWSEGNGRLETLDPLPSLPSSVSSWYVLTDSLAFLIDNQNTSSEAAEDEELNSDLVKSPISLVHESGLAASPSILKGHLHLWGFVLKLVLFTQAVLLYTITLSISNRNMKNNLEI
jgi:hypothetical protein